MQSGTVTSTALVLMTPFVNFGADNVAFFKLECSGGDADGCTVTFTSFQVCQFVTTPGLTTTSTTSTSTSSTTTTDDRSTMFTVTSGPESTPTPTDVDCDSDSGICVRTGETVSIPANVLPQDVDVVVQSGGILILPTAGSVLIGNVVVIDGALNVTRCESGLYTVLTAKNLTVGSTASIGALGCNSCQTAAVTDVAATATSLSASIVIVDTCSSGLSRGAVIGIAVSMSLLGGILIAVSVLLVYKILKNRSQRELTEIAHSKYVEDLKDGKAL